METDSKNKRGRPDVYARDFGENAETVRRIDKQLFSEGVKRSRTNRYYANVGLGIARDVYGESKAHDLFTYSDGGNMKNVGILEQVGRMSRQDGYSADDCVEVLKMAMMLRDEEGFTVKQIVRWIRNGRTTGEWLPE